MRINAKRPETNIFNFHTQLETVTKIGRLTFPLRPWLLIICNVWLIVSVAWPNSKILWKRFGSVYASKLLNFNSRQLGTLFITWDKLECNSIMLMCTQLATTHNLSRSVKINYKVFLTRYEPTFVELVFKLICCWYQAPFLTCSFCQKTFTKMYRTHYHLRFGNVMVT